jgi:hypothetical protein
MISEKQKKLSIDIAELFFTDFLIEQMNHLATYKSDLTYLLFLPGLFIRKLQS